jgi:hypothetical protein
MVTNQYQQLRSVHASTLDSWISAKKKNNLLVAEAIARQNSSRSVFRSHATMAVITTITSKGRIALSAVGRIYETINANHPRKLNCAMAFSIASLGDIGCQYYLFSTRQKAVEDGQTLLMDSSFLWDTKRTFDMGTVRSLLVAPFLFTWYRLLSKITVGGRFVNLFSRLLVDQTIGGPVVVSLVFMGNGALQWPNCSLEGAIDNLIDNGPTTWMKGLQYNPFVNCLNFYFFPVRHQPLVAHFTAIYWTAILSYYSNLNLR